MATLQWHGSICRSDRDLAVREAASVSCGFSVITILRRTRALTPVWPASPVGQPSLDTEKDGKFHWHADQWSADQHVGREHFAEWNDGRRLNDRVASGCDI